MQLNIRVMVALSLFLSLSVSAIQFVNPKDVKSGVEYGLTLSTNPTRLLVSHDAHLRVETFNALEPFNAENLGPDESRRWEFTNYMEGLKNRKSMGGLWYHAGTLRTDSVVPFSEITHIELLPSEGGIKIQILDDVEKWVNDMGHIVLDENSGATWMITEAGDYKEE